MHYILKGHDVIPCNDLMHWAKWLEEDRNRRQVSETEKNDVRVSTVFLGLDHNFGRTGPPIVFETMIFGGEHDQYQERYSTWDEAIMGHKQACILAFGTDKIKNVENIKLPKPRRIKL